MVEPQPSKLKTRVRFPSPALFEMGLLETRVGLAAVAQLVERVLGKDEVTGPSPVSSFHFNVMLLSSWCVAAIEVKVFVS